MNEMTKKPVLYEMTGTDRVTVRRDVGYRATDAGPLAMDLYYPPDWTPGARLPAAVIVLGYSDVGFRNALGCQYREMAWSVSWGRLIAASGIIAITYTNREPLADLRALLEHLQKNAASLGVDRQRIAIWGASGNVPLALSALVNDARDYATCAVFAYGYLLDLDGATGVADAAATFKFANPCAGKTVDDVPKNTPVFIARAGQDQFPGLNDALDRFVAHALARNLPVTVVNHATGPHAFDMLDGSATTRDIVAHILAFLRLHLLAVASR
jgi:hypothetical protein